MRKTIHSAPGTFGALLDNQPDIPVTISCPYLVWMFVLGVLSTISDPSEILEAEFVGPVMSALEKADAGIAGKTGESVAT
jgi:hypothetical protein